MPLLIGQGTKLSYYLVNHDKEYVVTLQLGIETDTLDSEGKIVKEEIVETEKLEKQTIENALNAFIGESLQIPPIYSAIKVNGKKLYEYARKNEEVDIKQRKIKIYKIDLKDIDVEKKQIKFIVNCSKGTYIRSLCRDIAKKLNTIGYMKELERTVVGKFKIEDSVTLEELEKNKEDLKFMENQFITIEKFFEENAKNNVIYLDSKKINLFLNGVQLSYNLENGLYRIYSEKNVFIGIGIIKNQLLKREIIVENKI